MRYGENALRVIDGIKKKLEEIKPSLPEGVELITTYDRSQLIKRSIATLREMLIEESIVVALVCLVFLWHILELLLYPLLPQGGEGRGEEAVWVGNPSLRLSPRSCLAGREGAWPGSELWPASRCRSATSK